ncbi:diguanylate cyclase [Vibrio astriarenae]|nr:diguanylate cyclase [Vibrio sp. C7]
MKTVGIKPESVEFEVTETAFAPNDTKEVGVLTQLKALGIHLAIDDFGTGFTSFNQLIAFPFDTLKIDKTFVDQILNDSSSGNEMVDVLYRLAQSYSLKVVAEGVETNEQVKVLSELGCNYLQGYYFSEPVPESEVVYVAKRFRASVSRLA